MTSDEPSINYTVKELVKEIRKNQDLQHQQLDRIEAHVIKTNGRVTLLENKSWGKWVSENPFKFTIIIVIVLAMLIGLNDLSPLEFISKFV